MAALQITSFGGEQPSVSPRSLPATAAQVNSNLFLGSAEFWPLAADVVSGTAPAGTKTMHRFARSGGWVFSADERSYVKGQVNDASTERTYLTFDNGSQRPRAIDNVGQDRILGVPKPSPLTTATVVVDEFTKAEASDFMYGEAAAAIRAAVKASILPPLEPDDRTVGGPLGAGPRATHGLTFARDVASFPASPWAMLAPMDAAKLAAVGLVPADTLLISGTYYATITCLPSQYRLNAVLLKSGLLNVKYPASAGIALAGKSVMTDAQATDFTTQTVAAFNINTISKKQRDELDRVVAEFAGVFSAAGPSGTAVAKPVVPVEPTRPAYPQYQFDGVGGEGGNQVQTPAWNAYDVAMLQFRTDSKNFASASNTYTNTTSGSGAKIRTLQAQADALTKQIEEYNQSAYNYYTGDQHASDWVNDRGGPVTLAGAENLVERITETRFYIATFVTTWGEESAPSPVSNIIEMDQNDKVTITRPAVSSGSYASRFIDKWRLYRTNTGSEASAFQFVAEIAIGLTSYEDKKKSAELGEVCPTTTWVEPPPNLAGLKGMPNGVMAGFFGNTVTFCEPYVPYAWPVEYQIVTEYPIVGLGVFGQTLFVGTTGNPYFISGADSASMSAQKLDSSQSCASRKSIVGVEGGVIYASPDGLCLAGPNGVQVITQALYAREDWQKLNPSTMTAGTHENIYYLFYNNGTPGCLAFDLQTKKLGRVDLVADAVFTDLLTDTMYVARGSSLFGCFVGATRRTAKYRTPKITLPAQAPLAWLKVYGDQELTKPVVVRWYGDGVLRHTATFTNLNPQRLPPGRWLEHEIEIESAVRVTKLVAAGNTQELQAV